MTAIAFATQLKQENAIFIAALKPLLKKIADDAYAQLLKTTVLEFTREQERDTSTSSIGWGSSSPAKLVTNLTRRINLATEIKQALVVATGNKDADTACFYTDVIFHLDMEFNALLVKSSFSSFVGVVAGETKYRDKFTDADKRDIEWKVTITV